MPETPLNIAAGASPEQMPEQAPAAGDGAGSIPIPPAASRRLTWISTLFGVALFAAVLGIVFHTREHRAIISLMEGAKPVWLLLGLGLQFGTYVADGLIWKLGLSKVGERRPLRGLVSLGLARLFMDQAIPSGGFSGTLLAASALERRGVDRPKTLAILLVTVLTHYIAYGAAVAAALAIIAARGKLNTTALVLGGGYAAVSFGVPVALIAMNRAASARLQARAARLRVFEPLMRSVAEAPIELARDPGLMLGGIALQLSIFMLDAGTMWAMMAALGRPAAPDAMFAAFMLASIARSLGLAPGGLGTFEAASVGTLKMLGVAPVAGLSATLLFRALSFWLPMIPGLVLARRETRGRRAA